MLNEINKTRNANYVEKSIKSNLWQSTWSQAKKKSLQSIWFHFSLKSDGWLHDLKNEKFSEWSQNDSETKTFWRAWRRKIKEFTFFLPERFIYKVISIKFLYHNYNNNNKRQYKRFYFFLQNNNKNKKKRN